jgi:hypothetical protein
MTALDNVWHARPCDGACFGFDWPVERRTGFKYQCMASIPRLAPRHAAACGRDRSAKNAKDSTRPGLAWGRRGVRGNDVTTAASCTARDSRLAVNGHNYEGDCTDIARKLSAR